MNGEWVGRKVVARVTRVEAYGVYLECDGNELIVLIPDVSHERVPDLRAKYQLGDKVTVRVLSYIEDRKLFKATIKDA
jgi:ribosomal protein S1